MSGQPFNIVPQHVARNPVARAVSKKLLVDAIREFQLRIHLLRDGENASSDVQAAAKSLTVTIFAMENDGFGDHPSINVMRGAISALVQCVQRGNRWRTKDAVAIDQGLQCVADLYPQLTATSMTRAWTKLREIEERLFESMAGAAA